LKQKDTTVGVVSIGVYLPKGYISAAELAQKTGIPQEIIETKMGLKGKHIPGPDDHPIAMGVWAAQDALAQTDIEPKDIDLVLCTTEDYRDYPLQLAGPKTAYKLEAHRAWAVDINQKCGTNVAALKIAKDMMVADDDINTVMITGGYRNIDLIDYANQRSRFMFDVSVGGGAFLLRKNYPRNHILETAMITDGSFADDVVVPAGGTKMPITEEALRKRLNYLDVPDPQSMKQKLDPISQKNFVQVIRDSLARSGYDEGDIGYLAILHMKRSIHEHTLQELGLSDDQSFYLEEYGHTGQMDAPISIKLGLESGRIKDSTIIVIVAAGIGYTWGATTIRWGPANAAK